MRDIAEVDASGGDSTIIASNMSAAVYRGGAGNDTLRAQNADVVWLYGGTADGIDTWINGAGHSVARAESAGAVISIKRYSNGVDGFEGRGDTIIRDGITGQVLDFRWTTLSGIAKVDAGGGNDTIWASMQSDGCYRGGTGKDTCVVNDTPTPTLGVSILDFSQSEKDLVDLHSLSTSFKILLKWQQEPSGDTTIQANDAVTIRLVGFPLKKLKSSDFIF